MFVGIDVYHAPRKYDSQTRERSAKSSVAAIVVQMMHSYGENKQPQVACYSETFIRRAGNEYELGKSIETAVKNAVTHIDVSPMSCIVWRDGVGDGAIECTTREEVTALRRALQDNDFAVGQPQKSVPIAYMICQKRIATKFMTQDGYFGLPAGTLVHSIENGDHPTFYINGSAPSFSTPKPVRYIISHRDKGLADLSLPEVSWAMCHDYANWAGPIRVPSVCQQAHKLAELTGNYPDSGLAVAHGKFKNKMYYL
jgi:aubergine